MGVQSWDLDVAANATTDPTIPAHDGGSLRNIPDLVRALMAGVAALRDDQGGALVAKPGQGTPNSFTVATNSGVAQLRAGLSLAVAPLATNTDACFLNVDGTGPLPWVDGTGAPFAAGRLRALRATYVVLDATNHRWVSDYDGNVENTLDANKPQSALQAAAVLTTALRIGTALTLPAPALSQIAAGQVPTLDMFSPARNGSVGDETLLNNILNGHNICIVKPGGPVTVKNSPIIVPANAKLLAEGGRQAVRIVRDVGYSGDTLQMGGPAAGQGAGSASVRGFAFDHPGRFVGLVPDNYVLTNRLTGEQAHIRVYGAQGASIVDCFDWGMPHSIVHSGGSGLDIVRHMKFGGMWNPLIQAQQESLSFFKSVWDPVHGYSVNGNIIDPNIIGGNIAASPRNVALDNKTYTVTNPRIGPKHAFLLQCFEVLKIRGGFSGGLAQSNFHFEGGGPALVNGSPAWVMIRVEVDGHSIDESMTAAVEFVRTYDTYAPVSGAFFRNCNFNGQLVGARAITTSQNGKFAVGNLVLSGGTLGGYQGGVLQLFGVDGGLIAPERIRGYNYAGFDTTKGDALASGAGAYLGDVTRNVKVMWPVFGGGVNYDMDPNSCQWGLGDVTPAAQGNRYYGLDAGVSNAFLGLAGGGPVIGGTKFTP